MMLEVLAYLSLGVAGLTCLLFVSNFFFFYRRPPVRAIRPGRDSPVRPESVSVLIPARNEPANIERAVTAILANRDVDLEVIVLDDHSQDATPAILDRMARQDARIRWAKAPPLPDGWCGKQHACHHLASLARHEWMVFVDADVRLAQDALARMLAFMLRRQADLASGVPRQVTESFLERLLLPLIHFILLGYLPMAGMRWSRHPAFSAGCGQLFIARRSAYLQAGGHAMIRASLHDGLTLPRAFRRAGLVTDLFDATDLAACRMYHGSNPTWQGLQKNATEGLAAPDTIGPMTMLLFLGQVLPFILLAMMPWLELTAPRTILLAAACAWAPRFLAAAHFQQSYLSAVLHPLGIALLLANQWTAWWKVRHGHSMQWRDRTYPPKITPQPLAQTKHGAAKPLRAAVPLLLFGILGLIAVPGQTSVHPDANPRQEQAVAPSFQLTDQNGQEHKIEFPRNKAIILAVADRDGARQLEPWIQALRQARADHFEVQGLAPLGSPPSFWRGRLVGQFKKQWNRPILLDWGHQVSDRLDYRPDAANVFVIRTDGTIQDHFHGEADKDQLDRLQKSLHALKNP